MRIRTTLAVVLALASTTACASRSGYADYGPYPSRYYQPQYDFGSVPIAAPVDHFAAELPLNYYLTCVPIGMYLKRCIGSAR